MLLGDTDAGYSHVPQSVEGGILNFALAVIQKLIQRSDGKFVPKLA